jgi:hypothetical protein
VYLKSTGSNVFDEAYFVVRESAHPFLNECDMIKEANRILDECMSIEESRGFADRLKNFTKRIVIPFLGGMIIGIITAILII